MVWIVLRNLDNHCHYSQTYVHNLAKRVCWISLYFSIMSISVSFGSDFILNLFQLKFSWLGSSVNEAEFTFILNLFLLFRMAIYGCYFVKVVGLVGYLNPHLFIFSYSTRHLLSRWHLWDFWETNLRLKATAWLTRLAKLKVYDWLSLTFLNYCLEIYFRALACLLRSSLLFLHS